MRFVCDSCRASYRISDDKVGPKGVKVRCQKCGFVILVRRPDEEPDEALMTQVMSNPLAPMDALEEGEASLSETPAPGGDGLGDDVDAALSFGDDAPSDGASQAEAPAPAAQQPEAASSPEGGLDPNALFGDDDEDEIGAIFDSVLNSGSHSLPGGEEDPSQVATKTLDVASMARAMDQSVASEANEKHELTPALPSNEWFVAIDENQVGPVGIDVLKEHWDRGEIGPDSLCWRAGMADWIPLSEVTELQRHLAPKPSKPAIVSPSPAPAATSVAGVTAASGAGEGGAAGGWKPSAASALASLVKDELEVISRPAPVKKAETGSGLLDVPPVASEPVSSPGAPAAAASMNLPLSATSAAPEPLSAPSAPAAAAPYADLPPYQALPPVQQKKPMGLWIGVGALVVLLLGGVFFLLGRTSGGGEVSPVAAAPAQPPAPEPAPQAVAQVDEAKKAEEEAAAKKAQEEAEKAALAKAEEEKKKAEEEAAKKAEEEAALAAAEEEEEQEDRTVARRPTRRRTTTTRASAPSRTTTASRTPTPSAPTRSSGSSDPFDDIFGPSGDSGSKSTREASRPATYVPPAPSSVPAELSSSDIAQAVVAKRNELNSCVQKAKAADPSLGSGRMAMRWTIETSGRVSGLSNQTAEVRGSQLDKCVSGVIQKITFPRHRKAGGQVVTFPITF